MIPEEWLNYTYSKFPQKFSEDPRDLPSEPGNIIVVYIVLFALRKMRTQLGLEATLEYAEGYIKKMEKQNPKLRGLVNKALSNIDIARMHEDAVQS